MRLFPRNELAESLDPFRMLSRLHCALVIGVIFIAAYAMRYWGHWSILLMVLAIGILGAGASLLAGFLLGFIFGIPRMPQRHEAVPIPATPTPAAMPGATNSGASAATTPAPATQASVEANSNLVEISDWLTKIFVGVGLVELAKIPGKMELLASFFAAGLVDYSSGSGTDGAKALAMAIIVFFSLCGFMIAYLWARLYLQKALGEINRIKEEVGEAKASIFIALSRLFTGLGTWLEPKPGQIGVRYFERAIEQLDKGLAKYPNDPELHFEKAIILKAMATREKPFNIRMIEKAVGEIQEVVRLKPDKGGGWYNLACYQALTNKPVKDIVSNLKRAFELAPELRAEAATDPDFEGVRTEPDFQAIVAPGPSMPPKQG